MRHSRTELWKCVVGKWKSTDQTSAHNGEGDLGRGWNTEWVRALGEDKVKMLEVGRWRGWCRRDQEKRTACHDEEIKLYSRGDKCPSASFTQIPVAVWGGWGWGGGLAEGP